MVSSSPHNGLSKNILFIDNSTQAIIILLSKGIKAFLFPACQFPVSPDMILEFQQRSAIGATGLFLARYGKGNSFVSRSSILRSALYTDIMTMSFDEGPGVYDRQVVALRDLSFRILR